MRVKRLREPIDMCNGAINHGCFLISWLISLIAVFIAIKLFTAVC